MDSKRAILLDSVKKLLALGIPESEIVANLRQVNVSDPDARNLLLEAKGLKPPEEPKPQPQPQAPAPARPAKKAEPLEEDVTESEDVLGEVYQGLEKEEPEAKPAQPGKETTPLQKTFGWFGRRAIVEPSPQQPTLKPGKQQPAPKPQPFRPLAQPQPQPQPQPTPLERKQDVEQLWESGILTAIDARLDEMKRLRQELETILDAKVQESTKKASLKLSVLLDSQRTLTLAKVQAETQGARRQVEELLNQKLEEIRRSNEVTQENLTKIQAQRQLNEELSKDLAKNIRLLEDTKAKWLAETNNELQRAELKFGEFLKTAEKRLDQLEGRISKALEVESHITEGVLSDVKLRVDQLAAEKAEELGNQIRQKFKQLDQSQAMAAFHAVEQKLKDLSEFRDSLRKDVERDFDAVYRSKIEQYNKQVKDKLEQVDAVLKDANPKEIKAAIGDFRLFQEDFSSVMKANTEKFNAAKKELNSSLAAREKAFDDLTTQLEQRLRELSKLEEKLSALLRK